MSSGAFDRLWKLETSANALVLEGKRESDSLIEFLQRFVFGTDLSFELWLETYKALDLEDKFRQVAKKLVFPENQNLWFVPMVPGVTSNKIVAGHRRFGVQYWLYGEDLDTVVPTHDRCADRDGPYIVGFQRNVEADPEFANKSATNLGKVNHKGICLPERLMLGAGYHVATGRHLDVENWTLCPGSRHRDGNVPSVDFHSNYGRVYVGCYSPFHSSSSLRARSVQFLSLAEQAAPA